MGLIEKALRRLLWRLYNHQVQCSMMPNHDNGRDDSLFASSFRSLVMNMWNEDLTTSRVVSSLST